MSDLELSRARRLRRISIGEHFLGLIVKDADYRNLKIEGVPRDAQFRGFTLDPITNSINVIMEHESFEEVPEGVMIPDMPIKISNPTMNEFDITTHVNSRLDPHPDYAKLLNDQQRKELRGFLGEFNCSVANEVKKTQIRTLLTTREHQFSSGPGDVADRLFIEVEFRDAIIQPHSDFEDDFASSCVLALEENVYGILDNSMDDGEDDEDAED